MEKIKNILSGHSSKETSNAGEGSHFNGHENAVNPENQVGESTSGRGMSEASTDQGGHKLSTGLAGQDSHLAGATSNQYTPETAAYPGMTQDTRQTAPTVAHTGNTHGSGKELGSTAAAEVTPGFAGDVKPDHTQQRSFPLSSAKTDASTTAIYHGVSNPGSSTTDTVSRANPGGVAGTGGSSHQTDSGYYGTAQGPHSTNTANLLDPALSSGVGHEDAIHHSPRHGGGAEEADTHHSSDSHRGLLSREAALGTAAAAGVAGVTENERNKHRDGFVGAEATPGTSSASASHDINTTTSSSHPTTTGTSTTYSGTSHHGRDAATAGGVAGAGAYAAEQHIKSSNNDTLAPTGRSADTTTTGTVSHHYGRDAAIAGGAGAAGVAAYQADQHKHDKDLTEAEREAKKQHKHAEKEAKKEHHHSKEVEKEHNSHAGRNTALGAGAAGVAAYQADQHKHDKDLTEAEREAKKQHKHAEKEAKKEHHHSKEVEKEHNSHAGRNTALGAGVVGAGAGAAAYEADKPRQVSDAGTIGTPLDQRPEGKDLGDRFHGVDRNRGVVGSSGFPGTEGFGSGVAYQPNDWKEAVEYAKQHNPNASTKELKRQEAAGTGIGSSHAHSGGNTAAPNVGHTSGTGISSTQHQSHDVLGTGAGTTTTGGLAHRQAAHNTSSNYDTSSPSTGNPYGTTATTTTTSGLGSNVPSHHAGSTTTSGLGGKTSTSDATTRMTNTSGTGEARVPASGATRSDIIGEGKRDIDSHTGVANADKKAESY